MPSLLQGFLDSLAYGVNSSILARWRKIFENLLCIRNKASREMNDGIENKDVDTIETTKNGQFVFLFWFDQ